ncbi:methionine ABC transporter ATP-binding protein [Candidatus Pantoea multigeneris]|uniref:ATP-binding cassette domain-containing protein n=1 Tax=Candidatus Pantoea multigeneris TaxID=2608357 RepID=A0ABX0R434_9GAMM|nr:methionine ABC transporter ATP-binding protein [Pantoea multigeneris]NIF20165.1 ATP-binding cassette domain-containing protein [Pantoea multigeneris]
MISIHALNKRYAGAQAPALDNVSLTIPGGSIYGIVGHSGAGKSTLLRSLNLLEQPDSGEILIDGENIQRLSLRQLRRQRQQIGMIFQHFNLIHSRTVADNIALPLEIAGVGKAQRRERVEALLALVGLEGRGDAWPSQLSGGQKQRVGIARALAFEPRYLLCDEATSALDPSTTQSILDLLATLQQRLNITVVLITHDMAVVKRICDHAALLEHGRLIESGPLAGIMAQPASRLYQLLLQDGAAERNFLARFAPQGRSQCVA